MFWRKSGVQIETARRHCVLIFSSLMTSALFIPWQHQPSLCIGLISIATFGYSGALANLLAMPGDVYDPDAVASVWGVASTGSGLGGMLFSLVTGWLVQRYAFGPAFLLFGALPLVAAMLVWTLPKRAEASDPGAAA